MTELVETFLRQFPKLHNGDHTITAVEARRLLDRNANGTPDVGDWQRIASPSYPLSQRAFWRLAALLWPEKKKSIPSLPSLLAPGAGPKELFYARLVQTPKADLHLHYGGNASAQFLYRQALDRVGPHALDPERWGGVVDWGLAIYTDYHSHRKLPLDDVLRRTKGAELGEAFIAPTRLIAEGQGIARALATPGLSAPARDQLLRRERENGAAFERLTTYSARAGQTTSPLADFLNVYRIASSLVETSDSAAVIDAAIEDALREFSRQGVRYAEMRIGAPKEADARRAHPQASSPEAAIAAQAEILFSRAVAAIKRGNEALIRDGLDPVDLRIIYTLSKSASRSPENMAQLRALMTLMEKRELSHWIVGVDGASKEAGEPPQLYEEHIALVKHHNLTAPPEKRLGLTWHQGEDFSDTSLFGALLRIEQLIDMGVMRLGHATALGLDPQPSPDDPFAQVIRERQASITAKLKARGVVIEVNPTSNALLVLPEGKMEGHPLRGWLESGVACTINTDDAGLFATNLNRELVAAAVHAGLSEGQLAALISAAFDASFAKTVRGESLAHLQ